ncbi:MAG: hypothetical protein ACQXXH_01495 [Candidatus Bathyarchaeia archaeon]|jgi:hypothetical protein|nr:hypothetical protein [Candidatus Bathyarchaeota archaeon A05DMB-4]MDH7596091.1 hypothetical protein [Candidatus Bathyarchaeota archaeon]
MAKGFLRWIFPRILKATIKALIMLIIFLVILQFLSPLEHVFPGAKGLIELYFMVYIGFIIVGELTKGTIYQYALAIGRAFFFIGYSVYALNSGIITATVEGLTLTVNLQIFLMMIILIGMFDFAKNLLHIINYLANKAETEKITDTLPMQEIPAK